MGTLKKKVNGEKFRFTGILKKKNLIKRSTNIKKTGKFNVPITNFFWKTFSEQFFFSWVNCNTQWNYYRFMAFKPDLHITAQCIINFICINNTFLLTTETVEPNSPRTQTPTDMTSGNTSETLTTTQQIIIQQTTTYVTNNIQTTSSQSTSMPQKSLLTTSESAITAANSTEIFSEKPNSTVTGTSFNRNTVYTKITQDQGHLHSFQCCAVLAHHFRFHIGSSIPLCLLIYILMLLIYLCLL